MTLPSWADRHDELHLLDLYTGRLDADRLCLAVEHANELRDRPPLFVAIAELVCGSTWERHGMRSVVGMVTTSISQLAAEVLRLVPRGSKVAGESTVEGSLE